MNVAQIIAKMRREVPVDTSQYSDANALIDLNIVKDSVWSEIVTLWKKLKWQKWTTSSVIWQSEYTLEEVASDSEWTKQLSWVSVCYDGETYDDTWELKYVACREVNMYWMEKDWDYYVENQDIKDPIFAKSDNSFFIAPAFKEVITNGIKLTGIRNLIDYTLSTTEAETWLSKDWHKVLIAWLCIDGHKNKWSDENKVQIAEVRYERELKKVLYSASKIVEENPFYNEFPE